MVGIGIGYWVGIKAHDGVGHVLALIGLYPRLDRAACYAGE
tara:strand:- start:27001 stop:27123 length:123 start_codon:yes stop_codon:yes gene_type:complete